MSPKKVLREFQSTIAQTKSFIATAHAMDTNGKYLRSIEERVLITESSFLRIFIAWEAFLEKSFVNYLRGKKSLTGKKIKRYAKPVDDNHAMKLLIGTNRYVKWSNSQTVRKLAELFFENGEPFETILASIETDLNDLQTIRNAAAHISSTTSRELDGLGTRKLKKPCLNIHVYDLILAIDPNITSNTILKTYTDILDVASTQIT